MSFKEQVQDWTEISKAQCLLGRHLGLFSDDLSYQTDLKHVFWTDNLTGRLLYSILEQMKDSGMLLYREEPDYEFKWNPDFEGSWE